MQEQQGALTCSGVYSRAQRHVAGCLDCQEHHTPSCRLHTVQMYSCTFCTYRLVLLHLCTIHSSREALPQARCALGGHLLCLQCITHPVQQPVLLHQLHPAGLAGGQPQTSRTRSARTSQGTHIPQQQPWQTIT
jgi:hypothetical protein